MNFCLYIYIVVLFITVLSVAMVEIKLNEIKMLNEKRVGNIFVDGQSVFPSTVTFLYYTSAQLKMKVGGHYNLRYLQLGELWVQVPAG